MRNQYASQLLREKNTKVGQLERAISLFESVLETYPGHLVAQYCIGVARKAMGDLASYQEAMDRCQDMLSRGDHTLAHSRYRQFKDRLAQLYAPSIEPALVDTGRERVRSGKPYKTRENVGNKLGRATPQELMVESNLRVVLLTPPNNTPSCQSQQVSCE